MPRNKIVPGLLLLFLAGCVTIPPAPPPLPVVSRYVALIRLAPEEVPAFTDDLDVASLRTAALQSRTYFESQPESNLIVLGPDTYTVKDMRASMTELIKIIDTSPDAKTALTGLGNAFVVYQSTGTNRDRTVVFTSYYEPTISARPVKDELYRYPLYGRPADLITADLGLFDSAWQGARVSGRVDGRALVPYSTRADIDSHGVLKNQGLELAWAKNPLDILDLQIEGSGWLDYGNQDMRRIRYDGDNGRRYRSVGQYLITSGRIPAKKFSREAYLKYLDKHPKERQKLLNVNERYIFFRIDPSSASAYAYGNIQVPLTPGRSIATDPKLFPKGALAWIAIDGSIRRFMLNQDEGGAIQGPGRVDVFAGRGQDAKVFASHLWNKGRLYFLVKKRT